MAKEHCKYVLDYSAWRLATFIEWVKNVFFEPINSSSISILYTISHHYDMITHHLPIFGSNLCAKAIILIILKRVQVGIIILSGIDHNTSFEDFDISSRMIFDQCFSFSCIDFEETLMILFSLAFHQYSASKRNFNVFSKLSFFSLTLLFSSKEHILNFNWKSLLLISFILLSILKTRKNGKLICLVV